jgi:hypothetical protein
MSIPIVLAMVFAIGFGIGAELKELDFKEKPKFSIDSDTVSLVDTWTLPLRFFFPGGEVNPFR